MDKNWLDNKTVIVTGASSGMGKGITEKLIKEHGCKVLGVARSEKKMEALVAELGEYASQFEVSGSAALRVKWNLNYYDLSSPSVSQTAEGWSTGSATGKSSIVAAPNVYADITLTVALNGRTIATLKASLVAEYIDNGANVEQQSFEFSAEIE